MVEVVLTGAQLDDDGMAFLFSITDETIDCAPFASSILTKSPRWKKKGKIRKGKPQKKKNLKKKKINQIQANKILYFNHNYYLYYSYICIII